MPFIIIVGLPASGKSTVSGKLKEYFCNQGKLVDIVSEGEVIQQKRIPINKVYADSRIEKEIRGTLKTEVLRKLSSEKILILDGLNYIKGYRYELYCASKQSKTTGCTVYCASGPKKAWELNQLHDLDLQYEKNVFDGLVQRFEEPDSRNRWDSPLITVLDSSNIPYEDVEAALYDRKPPPPNLSTQCAPLSDTNFLHEVDKSVQSIISDIASAIKIGSEGSIAVTGSTEKVVIEGDKNVSLPQLMRLKRQFIIYVKAHPELRPDSIATCFVQYLNTNL